MSKIRKDGRFDKRHKGATENQIATDIFNLLFSFLPNWLQNFLIAAGIGFFLYLCWDNM